MVCTRLTHRVTIRLMLFIVSVAIYAHGSAHMAEASGLQRIVLQLPYYHMFNYAGFYAAAEKGFYRDEGLAVSIREGGQNFTPTDKVLAGEAQYGVQGADLLLLHMQGEPLVILAAIFQHSPWALMVRAESDISTPSDLVDRTVMLELNPRDAEVLAMLRSEGISPDRLRIIQNSWEDEDLIQGRTDARLVYVNDAPYYMQQKGIAYRLISPANYDIDFYGDCLFTSERELKQHPKRVAAFRRASLKGWQYALQHPEALIDIIVEKKSVQQRGLTRDFLRFEAQKTRELIVPNLIQVGHMNPGRWRRMADTYVSLGMANPEYSLASLLYDPQPDYTWAWWLGGISTGVFALAALAGVWNVQLRRRVRASTQSLRESEEQYRRVVEGSLQGIMIHQDSILQYANQACAQILGYDHPDELIGQNFWETLIDPDVLPVIQARFTALQRGERLPVHHGWPGLRKDGTRIWLASTAGPISWMDKPAIVAFLTDVTERKQAEEALRQAHDELEAKVAERTKELTQANLRLQEVDRLKSEFLATMSHELRTPLNSIIGFTGLVLQGLAGDLTEEQRKQLSMVFGSANHLLSLINDILDLSRIESGNVTMVMEPFSITDVVAEVALGLATQIADKGLQLTIEGPDTMPELVSDRKRVFQILLNLSNNAVKFTERGEIRIAYRCASTHLDVSVTDTGIGIAPDNMALLFEAFRQVDGTTRRRYEGTGLGLYLCRKLVTLLGGRIWAESDYGKGSRFTCTLPLHPPKEEVTHDLAGRS